MNDNIRSLARTLSIMCVLGWVCNTLAHISRGHGWGTILPVINTVMSVVLAIRLRRMLKGA